MRRVKRVVAAGAALLVLMASALAATPASGLLGSTSAYLDPVVQSLIAAAAPSDDVVAVAVLPAVPGTADLSLLRTVGVDAVGYTRLPMAAVRGTPAQLLALAQLPLVRSVWGNHPLELALRESVQQIQADDVWAQPYGFTGRGVSIAILDSGIDGLHPDLHYPEHTVQNVKVLGHQKVFADLTFAVEDVAMTDTTAGHGTHVAGIAAGDGTASSGYYRGVAPGADVVGVGAAEGLDMVTALAGYDWILANRERYRIRVINNSWADGTIAYDERDPLNVASKQAAEAGITVVFAAGNDGQASGNVFNRYAWPSWVISVGGVDKNGVLGTYSSRGDEQHHADVVAPGSFIASARPLHGGVSAANATPFDFTDPLAPRMVPVERWPYYTVMLGTSMAAPHVAGVAALLYEANPALTPAEVRSIIVSTATPLPGCPVIDCGAGLVNALAAVQAALAAANQAPTARLSASPVAGAAPLAVTLDASASSDPDGMIVQYQWDTDGDGDTDATTTAPVHAVAYPAGVHHPRVTVVDDDGVASVPSAAVEVRASDPPVARATAPGKAKAAAVVTLDASASSDPDGAIVSYTVDWGDGTSSTSTSPTLTHAYSTSRAAVFGWRLVVTDDAGLTDAVAGTVKITP